MVKSTKGPSSSLWLLHQLHSGVGADVPVVILRGKVYKHIGTIRRNLATGIFGLEVSLIKWLRGLYHGNPAPAPKH